jgi:hypothetical protein
VVVGEGVEARFNEVVDGERDGNSSDFLYLYEVTLLFLLVLLEN